MAEPELSAEVRRLRKRANFTQDQLEKRTGIDQTRMSRIESGKVVPSAEEIKSLAKAFKEPAENLLRLRALADTADRVNGNGGGGGNGRELRVGAAHVIEAAPVLSLAYRGLPAGVVLSSYEVLDPTTGRFEPGEYCQVGERDVVTAGPAFARCNRDTLENVVGRPESESVRTLTGAVLADMLFDQRLDCIIAAGELYNNHDKRDQLIRCAQIMSWVNHCDLVLCAGQGWMPAAPTKTRAGPKQTAPVSRFNRAWAKLQDQCKQRSAKRKVPVLFAPKTRGEAYFDDLRNSRATRGMALDPVTVPLGDWPYCVKAVGEQLSLHEVCLFIAWEPQVSWLKKAAQDGKDLAVAVGYQKPYRRARKFSHQSFDLIFSTSSYADWIESDLLLELVDKIAGQARLISKDTGPAGATVKSAAHYLDMTTERCEKKLRRLDFSVAYYPEWVRQLVRRNKRK